MKRKEKRVIKKERIRRKMIRKNLRKRRSQRLPKIDWLRWVSDNKGLLIKGNIFVILLCYEIAIDVERKGHVLFKLVFAVLGVNGDLLSETHLNQSILGSLWLLLFLRFFLIIFLLIISFFITLFSFLFIFFLYFLE